MNDLMKAQIVLCDLRSAGISTGKFLGEIAEAESHDDWLDVVSKWKAIAKYNA